jgi:anion-transporting  ArsA/GET3 family ATPase
MLGKILKYITITTLIMVSNVSFGTTFHDPLNYARALEILKTAKAQFEEIKRMYSELGRVHDELANTKRLIGNFPQGAENIMHELSNWRTYYDQIDTLDVDHFSAMDWLKLDDRLPSSNPVHAFNTVKVKLFEGKTEQMEFDRQQLSRNSITSGIVVAEANKNSLAEAKKKIVATTDSSIKANDLLSAIKDQNKMLGVIASEMVQTRTIQAQQLELLAAFFSQFEGTGNLTEPARLPAKKNVWK